VEPADADGGRTRTKRLALAFLACASVSSSRHACDQADPGPEPPPSEDAAAALRAALQAAL